MRSTKRWRARLAAAATVSVLAAGGLIAGGGTPAAAVTQTGQNNYAGPKTCPRAGFDSCVNPTTNQVIVQGNSTGTSNNVYESAGKGEQVSQYTATGSNTATCSQATSASGSQVCGVAQHNVSGANLVMVAQTATLATGSTALTNVAQTSSQTLSVLQANDSGSNTIKGTGSTAEATQTINQTAKSVVNVPVVHTQQTTQIITVAQTSGNGANVANFKLSRTQSSNATGATANSTPSVTQKQDTGALPASPDGCEGAQPANGTVCVYQRASGASGTNSLKVRATDTKDENATSVRKAPVVQTQGPTPPALGGWLVRPNVDSPANDGGSTIDLGVQAGTQGGILKHWSMEAQGPLGGSVPGTRNQYDGIRLPIIGLSPDSVTSYEATTLTAPPGTRQIANINAVGHADSSWIGRLAASLTSDVNESKTVDFGGQNINASLDCTQNSPTTCSSLTTSPRTIETTEGSPFSGVVAGFVASTDATAGNFTASIDWGDGTTSSGTIAPTETAGQFLVSGSHTYADECLPCQVNVTVSSLDNAFTGTAHSTAFVGDAALTATPRALATPSLSFSGVTATFTDANPAPHLSDFTATIDWGDGSSSAGAVSGPDGSGVFSVSGSHTYGHSGSYVVKTVIHDVGGQSATAQSTLGTSSASAGGVNFSATEYSQYSGPVAGFTDANSSDTPSDFSATINWGDGSTSTGSIAGGNGSFVVSGMHTYNEEGTYTVKTTVTNVHNNAITSTATSTATVGDAPFTLTGRDISQPSTSFSGVVATGTDYENGISATINWGDGSTSSVSGGSGITADGHGGFTVSANHTYASTGTKTVTITARDSAGHTTSTTTTLHIGTAT